MSVTTDKADYAPGSTATFSVEKVATGASVTFAIADLPSRPGVNGVADVYAPFSVTDGQAGDLDGLANGRVAAQWHVPADGSATNATLELTATSGTRTATTTFSDASNEVVLENQKPGNPESEWGIDGAGSTNIEGFATDISVNRGNTVSFKINTNSNNYRIDIYRLGYYGGMGARKVATIPHTGVQSQPAALRDAATGLVDAGNWAVSANWAIPADAVSGVYIAKLVRQDGTAGENQIPFIVRNDAGTSDVIFQTSDETWQAYNPWGGANLYGGNGPGGDSAPGRAYAVSYNRPITTRGGGNFPTGGTNFSGPQDYIFGVEYPAIQWLEKNGYDVSYMAGVDSDRLGSLIKNHKMFLSVGHDEYWSGQQRTNVEAARDAGVNLSFWSGNEVYWETRFAPSISAGAQPYRTLVTYKETRAGPIDPDNQWTGTYRDPRFVSPTAVGGGRPENALTGTMFQVDSFRLDAITIPYDDANLRFWRNTSVAGLQPGQTATLNQNYLGYEWDISPDNGFRPAGLVELSSTTIPVTQYLLDYGTVTGSATATHNLTLYRAPSGALVFGSGTVYWAWGLDFEPRPRSDARRSPHQAGHGQPVRRRRHPAPDSRIGPGGGDKINGYGEADLHHHVAEWGGRSQGRRRDHDSRNGLRHRRRHRVVEVSTDNGATWHRAVGDETWSYSWVAPAPGTYTIKTRAVDDSINLEVPGAGRTVTVSGNNLFTAAATPPIVPDQDPGSIELGMKFTASVAGTVTGVRYYKNDINIGTHTGSLWSSTGTRLATVTFTNESDVGWQSASFSSPVTITPGTTYVISYHASYGHYAATGNYFSGPVTNGPISAPVNAGVYAYGANSAFPNNNFGSENYWVDVLFNPSTSQTNRPPVAANDSGFSTTTNTSVTLERGEPAGQRHGPGRGRPRDHRRHKRLQWIGDVQLVKSDRHLHARCRLQRHGHVQLCHFGQPRRNVQRHGQPQRGPAGDRRLDLHRHRHTQRHGRQRHGAGQSRRQVPGLGGRNDLGHPLLQELDRYWHPYRHALVLDRHAAGNRHIHRRDSIWLADADLRQPRHDRGRHHLYRELPFERSLHRQHQLFHDREDQWPADRPGQCHEQQRRLCLWHRQPVPDQHVRRGQLLGRRALSGRLEQQPAGRRRRRTEHDAEHRARPRGVEPDRERQRSEQ